MLELKVKAKDFFDEAKCEFIKCSPCTLHLEHSLVSISKWESKWHKPFLSKDPKTEEESKDYIRCMTIDKNVDPLVYDSFGNEELSIINAYIEDPMTATWFSNRNNQPPNREIITSEIVYYWMIELGIPVEFERWHINRLLTLIKVCNEKNAPSKKMSKKDTLGMYRALNNARRSKHGTRG